MPGVVAVGVEPRGGVFVVIIELARFGRGEYFGRASGHELQQFTVVFELFAVAEQPQCKRGSVHACR